MSTTDTRAAFEAYAKKHCDATCNKFENGDYKYGHTTMLWKAWQAATEAAKATGTAGELPTLPDAFGVLHYNRATGFAGRLQGYTADQMRTYGQACAEAARQPAPVADQLKLICAGFSWRTDGDSNVLADRIEHHIRDLKAGIKARDTVIAERDAALAATAAPVAQPNYRMSEKPTAWMHTLPEGKFFNGAFSDNSQIIRDKDEADSECNFHGGILTPLFTAEWTQSGLDYVKQQADELRKNIVGSQP